MSLKKKKNEKLYYQHKQQQCLSNLTYLLSCPNHDIVQLDTNHKIYTAELLELRSHDLRCVHNFEEFVKPNISIVMTCKLFSCKIKPFFEI